MAGKTENGSRGFGPLESEVMRVVWAADGPVPVREVVEALNAGRAEPLAYTTVMTVMNRLAGKEALVRSPTGRSFVYEATAPDPAGLAVRRVIPAYADGATTPFLSQPPPHPNAFPLLPPLLADDV